MKISKNTFQFLENLKANNDREWFHDHKDEYKNCLEEFEAFTEVLISKIINFDARIENVRAKDCIFRIYKDTRFSKDKTPYKTHFGAFITPGGRKSSRAGYYIHIEPGSKTVFAGGLYGAEPAKLALVRNKIASEFTELEQILKNAQFKKLYTELMDDKLKTVPRGFKKDNPAAHLLRYKNYIVSHTVSDDEVLTERFLPAVLKGFKAIFPLNDFLNTAMD
ncbi:MAG: DUF2461 domain-containing protein [Leptospirales bacterium]